MVLRGTAAMPMRLLCSLLLDQTTLSSTLATLRTHKLVRAQADEADKQMRLWCLTLKGETLLEACLTGRRPRMKSRGATASATCRRSTTASSS